MKQIGLLLKALSLCLVALCLLDANHCVANDGEGKTLKDAYNGKFLIGVAVNTRQVDGVDSLAQSVIKQHFNAIVAENCMKSGMLQPKQGAFNFSDADKFVAFGEANNLFVTGHCLVWHSQAPRWFFTDKDGNDVSRDTLIARMKTHIQTVVGHFKGKVKGWDVVNEAIEDDGSYRQSKFYKIIGEDFIELAFRFAYEADPDCELYYNDYNMNKQGKREAVVKMVQNLQKKGIKIDGIGMQAHCTLTYPTIADEEASIEAFCRLGVKVMITELDVSVLPNPFEYNTADVNQSAEYKEKLNPYGKELPDSASQALTNRYLDLYHLFLRHKGCISRVAVWGVSDKGSWKNNFPVWGRTDYPLLFDRNYLPKPVVKKLIEAGEASK
ncbi:MAG TPA: endo-1,4-beta-xylanase [Prolixibacteraceae bacterium]|nr:endo-1,4-beta-xylanase [Prolixibacteraceae bacterium]